VSEEGSLHTKGEERRSACKASTKEAARERGISCRKGQPYMQGKVVFRNSLRQLCVGAQNQETLLCNTAYPHKLLWDGRSEILISDK